ncbi:MAG: DUF4176 domain-containing protein [Porcincola intestinalis]|uniref:DUF4176 domain-containing protein n=1 Tax=Porcincola intestinalis TaxID=2606632 RepID=UPI0029D5BC38|nr:DUF4176 domain-containing protein [Porcincola intestinalis]MCI6237612.1 DUF4176 domain-containing protein [Lachnospiraceae bacterium]MDY5331537.1 DUF4176 domain-containing protein [Porcincola intestinalis]
MRRRDSDIRHRVAVAVLAAGVLAGSAVAGPAAVYAAEGTTAAAGAESPKGAEAQVGMTEEAMSETGKVAISEQEHGIPADEWLPIGSVVKVRGYKRSFMVLGRAVLNDSDSRYYDYCACLYPDGYMGGTLYFFNQDLIARVESEGYEDAYEKLYREENLDGLDVEALTDGSQTEAAKGEGSESGAAAGAQETEESTEADQAGQTEPAESETAGTAYTTTTNVRLRSEPSTDGEALTTIPGGRQVTEDTDRKEKDGWIPVLFTDNAGKVLSGWIKKTYLK